MQPLCCGRMKGEATTLEDQPVAECGRVCEGTREGVHNGSKTLVHGRRMQDEIEQCNDEVWWLQVLVLVLGVVAAARPPKSRYEYEAEEASFTRAREASRGLRSWGEGGGGYSKVVIKRSRQVVECHR